MRKKTYMKVTLTREEVKFTPVIITLESQEEVDQMFALLDNNAIASCVPLLSVYLLKDYFSDKYTKTCKQLSEIIKSEWTN